MDKEKIEQAVRTILEAIGEDPEREGLRETPRRVARMLEELLDSRQVGTNVEDPSGVWKGVLKRRDVASTSTRPSRAVEDGGLLKEETEGLPWFHLGESRQLIIIKDIQLVAICEHHLLPFMGKAHVAYIPSGNRIAGFGKIARLVDLSARRLQVQERLTEEVVEAIQRSWEPQGVLVVMEAEHTCMTIRGARKSGSVAITTASRGLLEGGEARGEALALIRGR